MDKRFSEKFLQKRVFVFKKLQYRYMTRLIYIFVVPTYYLCTQNSKDNSKIIYKRYLNTARIKVLKF